MFVSSFQYHLTVCLRKWGKLRKILVNAEIRTQELLSTKQNCLLLHRGIPLYFVLWIYCYTRTCRIWGFQSGGFEEYHLLEWRRVVRWNSTDVSEELIASIFRVEKIGSANQRASRWQADCSPISQSYFTTDDQSVSKSWFQGPWGSHDLIFISVDLYEYCFIDCGGPLLREVGSVICHSHCPSFVSKYIQIYM
jgi:hypothetical protein